MTSFWERIIRGLGVFSLIVFAVAAFTPASNSFGGRLAVNEQVSPAESIVVLGAGLLHGGILSEESLRRALRGIELHKKGLAPILVFSGMPRPEDPSLSEADVRAKLATDMGVPSEAILKEETATTTREESLHIAAALRQRNVKRILLVTESLHMRRAKAVFERAGLEVVAAASADYATVAATPQERLWLTMRLMQETAALTYYRLAGYL